MNTILCVEAGAINEVEPAPNDISCGEGGTVGLTSAGAAEAVTIVSMVSVALFVPAWQPVHVDPLGRQTHPHVAVPPLGHYLDLKIIQPTGGWDGMGRAD